MNTQLSEYDTSCNLYLLLFYSRNAHYSTRVEVAKELRENNKGIFDQLIKNLFKNGLGSHVIVFRL